MGVTRGRLNRLIIHQPTTNDAGMYDCTALFSDGFDLNINTSVSGGSLRIFSEYNYDTVEPSLQGKDSLPIKDILSGPFSHSKRITSL